jgi:hypothetical protein
MEEPNLESLNEKIKKVDAFLVKYAEERCIFENKRLNIEEVKGYLQMDRNELRALSAEDCGEISFIICQLALEIQREVNKQNAMEKWADAQINKTIADTISNYKIYNYEGQRQAAIKDNEYARKCLEVKTNASIRVVDLESMAYQVKNLGSILLDIRHTKTRYKENA